MPIPAFLLDRRDGGLELSWNMREPAEKDAYLHKNDGKRRPLTPREWKLPLGTRHSKRHGFFVVGFHVADRASKSYREEALVVPHGTETRAFLKLLRERGSFGDHSFWEGLRDTDANGSGAIFKLRQGS